MMALLRIAQFQAELRATARRDPKKFDAEAKQNAARLTALEEEKDNLRLVGIEKGKAAVKDPAMFERMMPLIEQLKQKK